MPVIYWGNAGRGVALHGLLHRVMYEKQLAVGKAPKIISSICYTEKQPHLVSRQSKKRSLVTPVYRKIAAY